MIFSLCFSQNKNKQNVVYNVKPQETDMNNYFTPVQIEKAHLGFQIHGHIYMTA
jgi:hypothetical protein